MREIKFRIWCDYLKEYLILKGERFYYEPLNEEHIKLIADDKKYFIGGDSFVLEQYTGLKDKSGVEIYEGDLVKEYWQKEPSIIVYFNGAYGFFDSYNNFHHLSITNELVSIVGNIHDKENDDEKTN